MVGGLISFGAVVYTQAKTQQRDKELFLQALQRDEMAYQRSVHDAKVERIRSRFVEIAYAAQVFKDAGKRMDVLWAGETVEERDAEINAQVQEATTNLGRALTSLRLEFGVEHVLDRFEETRRAFVGVQVITQANARRPGTYEIGKLIKTLNELESGTKALLSQAKDYLATHSRGPVLAPAKDLS